MSRLMFQNIAQYLVGTVLLFIILAACSTEDAEFFERVKQDRAAGATWHYVGPSSLDPTSKALPLQCIDSETEEVCGEPFILFKLK